MGWVLGLKDTKFEMYFLMKGSYKKIKTEYEKHHEENTVLYTLVSNSYVSDRQVKPKRKDRFHRFALTFNTRFDVRSEITWKNQPKLALIYFIKC